MVTTPSPEEEKMELKSFLSTIKEGNFDVLRNNDKANRSDVNLDELKKEDLKLQDSVKEKNPVKSGWRLDVELVSNSKNKNVGSIDINIKYIKDDNSTSTDPVKLTLTGFKSLKTDLSSILFKTQSVGVSLENANTKENKTVLDLGSAGFSTLVDLNTKSMASSSMSSSESISGNGMKTRSASLSLRDDSQTKPVGDATGHTDTQIAPAMMGNKFSTVLSGWINSGSNSNIKTELQKLETAYTGFKVADLYIDGAAKLNFLYKKSAEDWQGSYYLTSKDDSSKLTLKVKTLNGWSLEIPSIVVQDLLPDSVKVFVSKIGNDKLNIADESNIDAYVKQKAEEDKINQPNTKDKKYVIKDGLLYVRPDKFTNNKELSNVLLNPIKVPYNQEAVNDSSKVLFKTQYVFDGIGIFNGDIFSSNLKFKKAYSWDNNYDAQALKSEYLSSVWYGINYIPGAKTENINVDAIKVNSDVDMYFKTNPNKDEYYSKGLDDSSSISGDSNTTGDGSAQLTKTESNKINRKGKDDNKSSLNSGKGTNYLIYPRIKYKKNATEYSYWWSTTVTIAYFAPMTAAVTPASATPVRT
ncbi:hypothetical protein LNO75_02780 [Mycoplasma sp. T363T]|uniref:hypothetical protein n=1 Tax=Mycoplasma bradburyae TaxID=2963128 RepID=UPI002340E76D|nr:hypothetical protein [Mycoplasma bradburyae]MDC4163500.1 hypothetical protein [Mycoplasma bradburyae]